MKLAREKAVIARRKRAEERKQEKNNSRTSTVESPTTTVESPTATMESTTVNVVEQPTMAVKKKKKIVKYVQPYELSDESSEDEFVVIPPKRKSKVIENVKQKKMEFGEDAETLSLFSRVYLPV